MSGFDCGATTGLDSGSEGDTCAACGGCAGGGVRYGLGAGFIGSTDAPNIAVDGIAESEGVGGGSVVTGSRGCIAEAVAYLKYAFTDDVAV